MRKIIGQSLVEHLPGQHDQKSHGNPLQRITVGPTLAAFERRGGTKVYHMNQRKLARIFTVLHKHPERFGHGGIKYRQSPY